MRHAVIVGGGIGGLSAAVGLHRIGWRVSVLEQAEEPAEIGAGITLWPTALAALDALGLGDRVRDLGSPQPTGGVRTSSGRWISRMDEDTVAAQLGGPMLAVHRARLHRLLWDELPPECRYSGVRVTRVERDGTVPEQPGLPQADLVIGADGIDSRVRAQHWPRHPPARYTGLTAWRGICRPVRATETAVSWGRGTEFGIVPLTDGRIYWYAALPAPEGGRNVDEREFLRAYFRRWHPEVRDLIDATSAENVLRHDIRSLDVPLSSFVRGRIALLGDAAHAMTPHLGQGGCQAIEDAAVLVGACAGRSAPASGRRGGPYDGQEGEPVAGWDTALAEAVRQYDSERRPRSRRVARASYWAGRLGPRISNPLAVAARNAAMRLAPWDASLRAFRQVGDWQAPETGLNRTGS